MYPGGYTVEVTCLSPKATEKDVNDFFSHCGTIEHLEIIRNLVVVKKGMSITKLRKMNIIAVSGEYARTAYVTFKDAYAVETAVLLSGATIVDQRVCIIRWGTYTDDYDPWSSTAWKTEVSTNEAHARPFVSSPGEAVTVAQEVVITMMAKGYDLGKDALSRAKAFDESHQVSATAAAKVVELSNRIGLTDKLYAGMEVAKSVDQKYHVSEMTRSAASYTGRAAVATANTVVNSSYFSKGTLWVSGMLDRASKAAGDLGTRRNGN